jgi:choline dehydrogenase
VTLRSSDPRDPPIVDFGYFDPETDPQQKDLDAVVAGIELARRLSSGAEEVIASEILPGAECSSVEALREFVKWNAWGHHASCTCKIGSADDPMAVVDGSFRVYGVGSLRIVDASVFPRIPGFFVVLPTYMISEKASDVILSDAHRSDAGRVGGALYSIRDRVAHSMQRLRRQPASQG